MRSDKKRWDDRFKGKGFALGKGPNPFLEKYIRLLPTGKAFDLAAGEGRNSVFLAQHGFDVEAVDISEKGISKSRRLAKEMGVKIQTILADLDTYPIAKERYDLIANFYFLKRSLIPKIKKGIKKGGRIIFETYILEHRNISSEGPKDRKYFLKPNELLRLFKDFRILFYREGIVKEGGRRKAVASLIAEKPKLTR
ncbi:MAG: methyltransferase domain-containing protein [Deltaproteobacteria bacterium]|nr:methyltransferase domain-containing protein [Deltaproteobacteria bacterium]MBM4347440.1 methyltransferase domain-containing protein [Deltaproteobacteria bacterium]